jgi:hypothetical protein
MPRIRLRTGGKGTQNYAQQRNPARAWLGCTGSPLWGGKGIWRRTPSVLDHQTATDVASHLRNSADDVATYKPGVSNSSGVVTTGVVSCELLSSLSGLCRGEGCASPSDTDSRLPLRREYLWIPHLSKRDLYARVLDSGQIGAPQMTCSIRPLAQPSPLAAQAKIQRRQHGG